MSGNNAVPVFVIGQMPQITALFLNATNTPTAPTAITFVTVNPLGAEVTTVAPNAAISNPSTGTYVYTYPAALSVAGTYSWRVKGTGTVTNADEGTFECQASLVITP